MSLSLLTNGMPGLIAPALAAGLLVASTHVPLGREVLKRGIIFLDLAVAQIAALGAIAAVIFFDGNMIIEQIMAFLCALTAAMFFSHLEKKGQAIQEAFIGCAFVLAAALSILIFSSDPHGGEEVSNLMAGQILWVSWSHLAGVSLIYAPILAILLLRPALAQRYFYILFAACITLSVQMVGVYLVFASLILPAMATSAITGRHVLLTGYTIAFIAVTGGLISSVLTDLPSGPMIVCTYTLSAAITCLLLRRRKRSDQVRRCL